MQYKVPQDVQREDTIIGPLTFKQMIILGVGGGIAYAIYAQLSATYLIQVWLPPVLIISVITLAFAFLKVHDLRFYEFLMHFIEYHLLARQRIWIQGTGNSFVPPYQALEKTAKATAVKEAKDTKSIAELSHVLDTLGESEMEKTDKHQGLQKLIQQNYKK